METASQSSFHIEASPSYDECVAQVSHAVDEQDEAHLPGALRRCPDRRALLRQFVYDDQASANFRILR
jgi:hypothetical protein